MQKGNLLLYTDHCRPTISQIFLASSVGLVIAVVAVHYRHRRIRDQKIIPRLKLSDSGRIDRLERFPHYVGNQISTSTLFGSLNTSNIISFSFTQKNSLSSMMSRWHFYPFPFYEKKAARQLGFKDRKECPHLCKLASEYIRKTEDCEDNIYTFFAIEPDADSLFIKLVEEFERCILSYFGFHWNHTDIMVSQVLSNAEPKEKLKNIVMAATR